MKVHLPLLCFLALSAPLLARPRLDAGPVQASGQLTAGRSLEVEVAVTNRSREIARGVLADILLDGKKIGQLTSSPDLAPGAQVSLQGQIQVPGDLAERWQGKDARQSLQVRVAVYRSPDLQPLDLTVETRPDGVQWTATITNQGKAPAPSLSYQFLCDDQVVTQKKLFEAVGPGESREIVFLDRKPLEPGKHRLSCVVNQDGEVDESDVSNNRFDFVWQAVANKPDLTVRSWEVEPAVGKVGTPVRVSATVVNNGEIELFRVPLALKVNGQQVAERKFYQSVPAKGEADFNLNWVPTAAGSYQLAVVCQGQTSPVRTVTVEGRPGYQLELVSANLPKRSPQGKEWVFDVVLRNSGTLVAEGVKATLWADGTRVWSSRLAEPLAACSTATIQVRWTADKPGVHQLRLELGGQGARVQAEGAVKRDYTVEVAPSE